MMERSRCFPGILKLIALALSAPAWLAIGPAGAQELTTRVGLAAQVGGCLPAMDDVNTQVRASSAFLKDHGWKQLDEVGIGFNFTGDLRARVKGPVWASIGGGEVFGRTGVDFDQVITIRPSASFYHLRLLYQVPYRPRARMLLRVGAGPVNVPEAKLKIEHEVRTVEEGVERIESVTFKGKGWGAHAFLEAEYILNNRTTLVADLGYRQLKIDRDSFRWKISEIELADSDQDQDGVPNKFDLDETNGVVGNAFLEVLKDPDGRPQVINAAGEPAVVPRGMDSIDFSGPLLNVGLRVYLF